MWNCAKQCVYWDGSGCGIEYNPANLLLLCPCFDLAFAHARDPTPAEGQATSPTLEVNDRGQRSEPTRSVCERSQTSKQKENNA